MQKGIIGKKIGMTQIFDEAGKVIPVTVVEAGPCVVVQKKTVENDGYEAVQLGFGDIRAKRVNKPLAGHFKKADVAMATSLMSAEPARVKASQEQSNVTTIQGSRKLTVPALFTDTQAQWALVHLLREFTRARECRVIWALKR